MNTLPDAVRLADWVDSYRTRKATVLEDVATELRRLHEENENLKKAANRGGHMTIAWNEIERLNEVNQMLVESAEMALGALDTLLAENNVANREYAAKSSQALRQALAQPEQEPVAWADKVGAVIPHSHKLFQPDLLKDYTRPLYTAPLKREWVGLTEEELEPLCDLWKVSYGSVYVDEFARAIEAKLKERNGG